MMSQHRSTSLHFHCRLIALLTLAVLVVAFSVHSPTEAIAKDKPAGAVEADQAEAGNKKKGNKKQNKKDKGEAEKSDEERAHEANYFGISTTGKEIIYVVDNSNSMSGGRFNAAADELLTSVKNLRDDQSYYVVLFSDTAYPLGYPDPVKGMQKPTEQNIKDLEYWLENVELCLKTNAAPAVMASLGTKPDTIYLLTDGAFTDDTMKQLGAVKSSKARIHTIGLNISKGKAVQDLKTIAEKFGGEYREVNLNAEKKKKYAEPRRKKNNTRGKVWGKTLKAG